MANISEPGTISVSPDLIAEMEVATTEERRPISEIVGEAIERYLENRRWKRLLAYGEERGRASGYTEEDVPRLIAEVRAEQRQGR
jgi:metal-responsive CopG/Arc/MetJ family transcriptional regulator